MEEIIVTENLKKHFGDVKAVDGIDLCIKKGEIYGFLGLNGAGKTTTIRMLLGMIRPTSGKACLKGEKVTAGNSELWNKVGYLVEIPYSYPDLTVRENLEIVSRLRFIEDPHAISSVMEILKLAPYSSRIAKNLSLGNAQRLGLAKAIIHKPEILILDEPANGLDPAGIVEIRELLLELASESGVTIFVSSHILGEISRFASRFGIIHNGMLIQESDIAQMERSRHRILQIDTMDKHGTVALLSEKGISAKIAPGGCIEVSGSDAIENPENIATILVQEGFPPTLLKVEVEDLESYFLRIISNKGGVQ
jgi:ABC-2 type transport system ATP-binding protein